MGHSTASIELTDDEVDDLSRYLDVTRAEMLFARGVILVEGDAERFLVPVFAEKLGTPLDQLGITVCSVAGTNFTPYAKFLSGLGIPFSIVTDWDQQDEGTPLGYNRALNLVSRIAKAKTGKPSTKLIDELKAIATKDYNEFSDRCETHGVFTNADTLEVDLFDDDAFADAMIETLREGNFGPKRNGWIDEWEEDREDFDKERLLSLVEAIGKGRFAQRLATRICDLDPPAYIEAAIKFVTERV